MGCKVVLMCASMKLHLTPKNKERATTIVSMFKVLNGMLMITMLRLVSQ